MAKDRLAIVESKMAKFKNKPEMNLALDQHNNEFNPDGLRAVAVSEQAVSGSETAMERSAMSSDVKIDEDDEEMEPSQKKAKLEPIGGFAGLVYEEGLTVKVLEGKKEVVRGSDNNMKLLIDKADKISVPTSELARKPGMQSRNMTCSQAGVGTMSQESGPYTWRGSWGEALKEKGWGIGELHT